MKRWLPMRWSEIQPLRSRRIHCVVRRSSCISFFMPRGRHSSALQFPAALAQQPRLLVAEKGAQSLAIIDPASGSVLASVPEGGITGHEVIASADGKLAFVPIYGNSGVGKPGTDGTEHRRHRHRRAKGRRQHRLRPRRSSALPHDRPQRRPALRHHRARQDHHHHRSQNAEDRRRHSHRPAREPHARRSPTTAVAPTPPTSAPALSP